MPPTPTTGIVLSQRRLRSGQIAFINVLDRQFPDELSSDNGDHL